MAAITQATDRKSAVSTLRFAICPLKNDSGDGLEYESTVTEIANNLITAKYTPKMNTGSQYASGMEVDSYVAKSGGTLDISVCGLTATDETLFFGSKIDKTTGVLVSSKNDVVPDVMVIYSTKRSDGKVNLYKFPKTKFTSQGESAQTSEENGVTYQATTLQGNYKPTLYDGNDMYCVKGVDLKTEEGRRFEAAWFATADGGIKASV